MSVRIPRIWWPVLVAASPAAVPWLFMKNRRFRKNCLRAGQINHERIAAAAPLDLPMLDFLELTVLVEWKTRPGFLGDPGVSYLLRTNVGSLLFDVGFGPARPALTHNATRLELGRDQVDALVISHLHGDHMGGMSAQRALQVRVPRPFVPSKPTPCFLPSPAAANGFDVNVVEKPRLLAAGVVTLGPLARSDFFLGQIEEQALLGCIKTKGLVIITGCGHPGVDLILQMARRVSDAPVHALAGGLHFPVTGGRVNLAGIQLQAILGTGKPPWQRITDDDLTEVIGAINHSGPPRKAYLSGHDTCDHALRRLQRELNADSCVLEAGATYRL